MRFLFPPALGFFAANATQPVSTPGAGILIFAAGIIIGMACTLTAGLVAQRRIENEYRRWISAGRPERRRTQRRKGGECGT